MIINWQRNIKLSGIGMLYIISMTIAYLQTSRYFKMYYLTSYIIACFWIFLALSKYIKNGRRYKSIVYEITKYYGLLMIFPWIIFMINNIYIYISGNGYNQFIKSSMIQIQFMPITILCAMSTFYIFKEKSLKYIGYTIISSYIVIFITQIFQEGVLQFFNAVITIFSGNTINNPFECSADILFALGLLSIYYFDKRLIKRLEEKRHVLIAILLIILGTKRIQVIALAPIFFLIILFRKIKLAKVQNIIKSIISIVFALLLYIYVYLINTQYLSRFIYSSGINSMGRVKFYDFISQYFDFSLNYKGHGYSFANLMLEKNGFYYVLHNDVLKIFVEMGFIIFTFWIIYNLFVIERKIREKISTEISNLYWFMTIYLFILYCTDNAINYFVTQTVFIVIIMNATYRWIYINNKNKVNIK
ncbi:hypothetical protein [Clostridium saudiense]|uniref:hypothetical protein n=1 Tax=Clostridium saudiense TaxID=1414720 RepID=UPI0018AC343F|nr:hypothetical protein [Clostridium saudiense]